MRVDEAAVRLGLGISTVRKWAAKLGVERHGRDYWITDRDLKRIWAQVGKARRKRGGVGWGRW